MLVQAFIFKVCPAWLELLPWITQGFKKELSCYQGQVDPAREVKFHSHLPKGKRPRQVVYQIHKKKHK